MQEWQSVSYFLLFYVIARLEWLNYKLGKLEGELKNAVKSKEKQRNESENLRPNKQNEAV